MKLNNLKSILAIFALIVLLGSCDKTKLYDNTIPPEQAHFVGDEDQTYSVVGSPAPTYNVIIGTTTISSADRVINYQVSSPSGAVAGTQYTIGTTGSVTIPAGQATAIVDVHGVAAEYLGGRKDTLVFSLTSGSVENATFSDTVKLVLRGPCFDGDVTDINVMAGNYANSTDPDDPLYTATVTNISPLTATTATGKITNLWNGIGGVDISFDWTDPLNTKVSIPLQATGLDYDDGQPLLIRTSPGQTNKFSVCNERLTLIVDLIVNNYPGPGQAAYYEANYPMTIKR